MKKVGQFPLLFLTILYLLTLSATYVFKINFSQEAFDRVDPEDAERNENSTPRSFILPATPAVAEEQERKLSKSQDLKSEARCISKLIDLGYSIDSFDPSFNATLVSATYLFQSENNLTPSGRLDTRTKEKLHCL